MPATSSWRQPVAELERLQGALVGGQRDHRARLADGWSYGLDAPGGRGVVTPNSGLELAGGGARTTAWAAA